MEKYDLKRTMVYFSLALILFFSLVFVSANSFSSMDIVTGPKELLKFKMDKEFNLMRGFESDHIDANSISVVWPTEGYYYITDFMLLEIDTTEPSSCAYNLDGAGFELMEETGGTTHYHTLYDLADNMDSELPYAVDFKCINGGESTAGTYFWINTSSLDDYFIRRDLDGQEYFSSELFWNGNDDGLLENYHAYYGRRDVGLYTDVIVLIFNNVDSTQDFINMSVFNTLDIDAATEEIEGQDIYTFNDGSIQYALWNSGRKVIMLRTYAYENSSEVDIETPLEILGPYLDKYPSQLQASVCGDGVVGVSEQCDGNSQFRTCSIEIGVCTAGNSERTCSSSCKWEEWGECHIVNSSNETCNNLDDDCDGETDEDNVCVSETMELEVYSPHNQLYNTSKIQFNITVGNTTVNKTFYIDWLNNDREITLCNNCNEYGLTKKKTKTFSEGWHNLTIRAITDNTTSEKNASFFIDSKKPKIFKTEPRQNSFANGLNFMVKYTEENVDVINLFFNISGLNSSTSCPSGKSQECIFDADLEEFDGKQLEYWFELTDVTGNSARSKNVKVKVDTTMPLINSFYYNITGKNVLFILNVTEKNFDELTYFDMNDPHAKESLLCASLKNGICSVKKTFKVGEHNLTINVLDKAGNIVGTNADFII